MFRSLALFSQERMTVPDTLIISNDTTGVDTIIINIRRPSANAVDDKVTYSAKGLVKRDLLNRKVILIQEAVVNYGEIEIKADSMVFNMKTNLLFAAGRIDSTGKIAGKPAFKEGSNAFDADELTYNFKTRKAYIKNIVTKQEDGLLHSQFTKLLEDGTSNISKSTYSTCDADTPHFYINLPKARVYPGKKIISGPGNLVLEGIPLPLFIPFGFFPIQTKKAASGILVPRIGQENQRGYSLTDGGYYFAINDYFDLTLKGNVYANGTWLATGQTSYRRLYKYSGNLLFSYASNKSGHKGLEDYTESSNYRLGWTYTQDPKASPGSRFSASVNMSSSEFDRSNSYSVQEHVTTQRQSSISYSKTWEGTPFNLSASMNHSQNVKTQQVSLNLPKVNFNASRIYPFKSKNSTGPTKWYQEIQLSYTASLDNQINTTDSLLFTNQVWKNMRNGFKHDIPLSIQFRPFKNFSLSPSVSYSGVLYTQKILKSWNATESKVDADTVMGLFYGHAFNPSINASFNPQIFGTFSFTNPNSRIQAIRHVIKPSVSFSYIPDLKGLSSEMYRHVQIDTIGPNYSDFSVFEGNIFGTPSLSKRSGNVALSLVNIVEAKVWARDDTTGKAKKVKILDNLGINTGYNVFADSLNWAPITMQARTTIMNNVGISANSSFSLYALNSRGVPIGTFEYEKSGKLMRMNNFTASLDFSLSDLLKGNKDKKNAGNSAGASGLGRPGAGGEFETDGPGQPGTPQGEGVKKDPFGYPVFDMPWSMSLSYSMNYYNAGLTSNVSQTLSFNGNVSVTKKMNLTYTSGYDFAGKEITMTQIGITRDLHCWEMNFNWVPNGSMKMWNFTIRVKASVLGDLKYERRKDFHDDY